ncbi:MAG: hypothetical protein M3494_16085 [Actinomycetota bacterium]|nr:hypothetical protein [Rubrobacter sp.]MDQ3509505.1 hypothetical protein [Actinomycetota bacterium]
MGWKVAGQVYVLVALVPRNASYPSAMDAPFRSATLVAYIGEAAGDGVCTREEGDSRNLIRCLG